MRWPVFMLGAVLLASAFPTVAAAQSIDPTVKHQQISRDLGNALTEVAWTARVPLVAELSQPLPRIEIAAGEHSLRYLLQETTRQAARYEWQMEGKAIHFYNRKLSEAQFNFLNFKMSRFVMPENVSELKLTFPTLAIGLLRGSSKGYAISGFSDVTLEKSPLHAATLENITGREILLHVANESPSFLTVIVFPNTEPTREQAEKVNINWFWQGLAEPYHNTLYVQPPVK